MNLFRVLCPACKSEYLDVVVHGTTKLLHRGLEGIWDLSTLPTPECVRLYDYVKFIDCGHCCPETFDDCPVCLLHYPDHNISPGRPTPHHCLCQSANQAKLQNQTSPIDGFDIFLSHNSEDKKQIRQLASLLKERNLSVWLDEQDLRAGQYWLNELGEIIKSCRGAAICLGPYGLGRWQEFETDQLIMRFVNEQATGASFPIIPVLLPDSSGEIPSFLNGFTWIDLRDGFTQRELDKLALGITSI
ncbi:MAG: toll/interleukin-1 receptor domain-containing protein [Leptolyngbya sp. SIO3F4]|nr:toll/interleukin-1 receptor domain-containing protein [Leptolyngbya sp. SIO3F4]